MIDGMGGGWQLNAVDMEMCFTHAISAGISSWQAECLDSSAAFVFLNGSGLPLLDARALNMDNWRTGDPNFERVENLGSLDTLLLCQQKM